MEPRYGAQATCPMTVSRVNYVMLFVALALIEGG
jgi:hypothetical protein